MLVVLIIIVFFVIVLIKSFRIVPQAQVWVVERLGSFHGCIGNGPHVMLPFLDRVRNKIALSELTYDVPPQPVFTKDTVSITADSFIFYTVFDPQKATYGVLDLGSAMNALAVSTLRNVIGKMDLELCLRSREEISNQMTKDLDVATDKWGIKVNRVEIKTFQPPRDIQASMERQMKADRERREQIIRAEAEKSAAILDAEKEKQVAILNAQAARESAELTAEANRIAIVQKAEAEKEATLLRAEAAKQTRIRQAEAEAEAIRIVELAKAEGLRAINAAAPSDAAMRLKAYDAFAKAADGQATKIIVPSDMQGIVGLASSIKAALH
ncbi:MAG: SPFH domain-containing protein [Bradymonadia bacterium]